MTDRRDIHLVLDTSAVTSYPNSIDVGETLAEVANEGGVVGIPLLCLVVAGAGTPGPGLEMLAIHPDVEVFADDPADWQALTAILGMVGRLPEASAALAAVDWRCKVLTRTPELYERLNGGELVIAF